MSYDIEKVEEMLNSGGKFWLDTNVFVQLAEEGHKGHEMLERLARAEFQLIFFEENERELSQLVKHHVFDRDIEHELKKFLNKVKIVQGTPHEQLEIFRQKLTLIEPLVPRQLAYDVLLSEDEDSFVSKILYYLDLYGKDPKKAGPHLKQIADEMKNIKEHAKERILQRAKQLIESLNLDESTLTRSNYFDSLEKMANNTVTALKVVFQNGMNASVIREKVEEMRHKNHAVDKRFAARIIAEGLKYHSNDNDVIMLLLLHSSMRSN